MKEKLAENDALIAYISNPEATIADYLKNGINAENT